MISHKTVSLLEQLRIEQNEYLPSPEIIEQIGQKTLICVVGPTCVGKSTVMDAVTELDSRYATAGNLTSREPRPDDAGKQYDYIDHSDEGLQEVIDKIRTRQLVQYVIHPTTQHLYGSELHHYPQENNLKDILASAVGGLRRTPFKSVSVAGIVAEPGDWINRLYDRYPTGDPEHSKRITEATLSLGWMLGQPAGALHWIEHVTDNPDFAAAKIVSIEDPNCNGFSSSDVIRARSLARQMLTKAGGMYHQSSDSELA